MQAVQGAEAVEFPIMLLFVSLHSPGSGMALLRERLRPAEVSLRGTWSPAAALSLQGQGQLVLLRVHK